MSHDLVWLLIRKNNSFMVNTVPEGPVFSKEPGNLTNLHSHKFSGLANAKTYHVADNPNGIQIVTRKTNVSSHAVKGARVNTNIRRGSGPRRAAGVSANKAKNGYRADLAKHLVGRVHALQTAQKEKKPAPERKARGRKAKTASDPAMDVD